MGKNNSRGENTNIVLIYVTVGDEKEGRKIALYLVKHKIAACVNMIPRMHAVYRWKGVVEESDECILLVKTRKDNVERVIQKIKGMHSYELPCIEVFEIIGGLQDFLRYVEDETQ